MTPEQKRLLPILLLSIAALPAPLLLPSCAPAQRTPLDRLQLPARTAQRTLPVHVPPAPAPPPAPRVRPAPTPTPRSAPRRWSLRLARSQGWTRLVAEPGRTKAKLPVRLFHQQREVARSPSLTGPLPLLTARPQQELPPGTYALRDADGQLLARRTVGSPTYQRHVIARYRAQLQRVAGELRAGRTGRAKAALRRLKARYRISPMPEPLAALVLWVREGKSGSYELLMSGADQ